MAEVTKAQANLNTVLGSIGTGLGAISAAGGITALLGIKPNNSGDPGDRPVTRYELGLIRENAELKAQQYADMRANGLQQQISAQAVWNATQEGVIRCQAQQLAQLYTLTQLAVPARNIFPAPVLPVADTGTVANNTATTGTGT